LQYKQKSISFHYITLYCKKMKRQIFEKITEPFWVLHYQDLLLLTDMSPSYLSRQLFEWNKKWNLCKLRNGVYIHSKKIKNTHQFLIANEIVSPSYISNESALYYRSMIPEAVKVIISITSKKTQSYDTHVWNFYFHHIAKDMFDGYSVYDGIAIARPEKAILDYLWYHKQCLDEHLYTSLRLTLPDTFDTDLCKKYLSAWSNKRFVEDVNTYFLSLVQKTSW